MKYLTIAIFTLFGPWTVQAQTTESPVKEKVTKHSLRFTVSDGTTLSGASFWGIGLADVVMGNRRVDQDATGVYALGYRYHLGRFRLGFDAGVAKVSSKLILNGDETPSVKEREWNVLVLPAVDFVYFERNFFELYGSAAVGINVTRHTEKGMTPLGEQYRQKKASHGTSLAYQANLIGVRVRKNHFGGFIEAGVGYRGFVTAGVTFDF